MNINILNSNIETILLGDLVKQKRIEIKRGKVIAKTTGQYPVYSSSIKNNGLMCYSDEYMFDEELISWSVDGGGDFFYRPKHKYSLTNVSGYIRVLDKNINCKYLYCILGLLHSREHFDYTTKAHPSVICKMYKVPLPDIKTQEKIATILFELENKVIKQEQIITKLKEIKQSFLELLFPNNSSGIPQLRFENFTDTWEQRKFKEIFEERRTIRTISEEYPQLSFTIAEGVIKPEDRKSNNRDFLIIDKNNKKYLTTEYDDIIYNPANVIFGAIHRNALGKGCVSPIYKIFYTDYDSKFMECIVRNDNFIAKISRNLEGTVTKLKTLKPEAFMDMSAYITTSKEEQKQIGDFFKMLDNLITLHQCKPFYLNFPL